MSIDQKQSAMMDRWLHFDSNLGDSTLLTLGADKNWICQVTYVHFEMSDGTYSDPSAFLFIKMSSTITVPVVLQVPAKLGGTLLPIRNPNRESSKIDAYFRGVYKNPDVLTFKILDANMQEVDTARIVVTLHFVADNGQIIIH